MHTDPSASDAGTSRTLRGLMDTLAAFVGLMTTDGVLIEANRAALDAAGLDPEDVLGKPFWEAYWWSYDPAVQAQLEEAVARAAAGEVVQYDVQVRAVGGELITIEFRVAPLRDEYGTITHLVPSAVDVTRRKRLEQDLREREAQLRLALKVARMGTFHVDVDTGALDVSETARHLVGADASATKLVSFLDRIHAEDRPRVLAAIEESVRRGEGHEIEYRVTSPNGAERWLLSRADVLAGPDGHGARLIGALVDISERKRTEAILTERFAALEDIYAHAPVGLCVMDRDLRFLRVNRRLAEINGAPVEDHIGRHVRDVVPGIADEAERLMREICKTGQPMLDVEIVGDTPAQPGVERVWHENWHPIRDADGEVVGVNIVALDVTTQVAAERALREHRERLEDLVQERTRQVRRLAASLSQAEQLERTRMARLLHDDVQQLLYALQIQVRLLRGAADPARVGEELENAHALLQKAIDVTRGVSVSMSPPVLREEGLAAALRWLAADMGSRYPLEVTLDVDAAESDELSDGKRSLLLHSARELLFNVVKHAGVQRAELSARVLDREVRVQVRDDGQGFDPRDDRPGRGAGFGLATMRERMELNGGGMTIDARPDEGTHVTLVLPVDGG